ncbi:MAG: ATP-binding cassette domain-containing protein, partial [Candidatus Bipolaricaulota bacterium]|nr:ATP-binding cassette domain-containing protein [Candidatus Bipolaricaulota bacterium]
MAETIIKVEDLNFYYGSFQALRHIPLEIPKNRVTAIIGPSGCGKSTFLKVLNRMFEIIPGARAEGKVLFWGRNILSREVDPVDLRRQIGMVFQKPNPFPKSIFENVAYGLRVN